MSRHAFAAILAGAVVVLGAPALYAANMVVNPGVDTGSGSTDAPPWERKNGGSSYVTSTYRSSPRSIQLINDYDGTSAPSHDVVQRVTGITAGTEYMYYVWVKGVNVQGIGAGGKPMGMLTWKNASGGTIDRWLNMHAPYGTYTWRKMMSYCEAPVNATQCDVYVRSWWDCTNGITYWDDFYLEPRDFSHRGSLLNTYQAETGTTRYDCTVDNSEAGYTGTGYVKPNSNSSYIQWGAVNVGSGVRYLAFRYSIEAGSPSWDVRVNGVLQDSKTPVVTSSPEGWATIEWQATLNSGDNTVRITPRLGVVGPWIEKLDVYAPAGTTPGQPTGLTATAISSTRITLSWTDADDEETGFKIDRRQSGATTWTIDYAEVGENINSYSDIDLPPETQFYYRVKAYNLVGTSPESEVADAETLPATMILVPRDATWRYFEGTAEASDPRSAWRALDFADSTWSNGPAPFGYGPDAHEGPSCNTVLSAMEGRNTTFYMRKVFTVSEPDLISELQVGVDYDDGFIIWINGERVAEQNAPDSPTYDSVATLGHEADAGYETFEVDVGDADLEPGDNVIAVQAFNTGAGSSDFKIDVELEAIRRVKDTKFSHDRGMYTAPFELTISTATAGATIKCTLNGMDPRGAAPGESFIGPSPLRVTIDPASQTNRLVNGTTAPCVVVRAYASKNGFEPTNVDTHSYLFIGRVRHQDNCMSGEDWVPGDVVPPPTYLAITDRITERMDTEMDPTVVNDSRYTNEIENALLAIPSMSLVGSYDDIFGNVNGFFHNSRVYGMDWEREVSLELIHPDGSDGFQIGCGARVSGAWSRLSGKSKMSLGIRFRSMYGAGKLRYELFPDSRADRFDHIRLRAQGNDKFPWDGGEAAYIRDSFGRWLQRKMGWECPTGRWVHLYINGMYWGLYDVAEVPMDTFMSEHYGGEREDYDVIANRKRYELLPTPPAGVPRVIDGANTDFLAMHNWITNQNMATLANYQQAETYLNMAQHADYILEELWSVNGDWDANQWSFNAPYGSNWRCGQNRLTKDPLFEYFIWDIEVGIRNGHQADNVTTWVGIGHLHEHLQASAEYKILFADRVYKHMLRPGGALTPAVLTNQWQIMADEIELPLIAESARWGDVKYDTPCTVDDDWKPEIAAVKNTFLALRTGYAVDDFRAVGLYPTTLGDPPEFSQDGGAIGAGFLLTISNPNASGTLVYRTDGGDPRAPGGTLHGDATVYGSAVPLPRTTHVKARVRQNNATWSAVQEATFNYTAHYPLIRLTEIHYNPLGGGTFEFLEIKNVGGSTVGLSEMTFNKGCRYTFAPGAELPAGKFAVLVRDEQAFTNRYPTVKGSTAVSIFGVFRGGLDNDGERLELVDTDGVEVFSVRYNDKEPWPEQADGDGFSIVYTGADDDQDHPEKWRESNLIGGSPGYDDGTPYRVLVNEALTHTDLPLVDAIELHNAGDASVNIGGWYLSDSDNNYRKFQIPSYSLPAGGYVVFDETDFNTDTNDPACFALDSAHGDDIYLTQWDANSNLLYLAEEDFGASANGVAFGRHTTTDGDVDFVAQSVTNTLGAENAYPLVGPVVVNELMYHPVEGEDEFIELHNMSAGPVALFDGTNTWKLTDAVRYTFPQSITLTADETVLVVPTNAAGFRAKYSIPSEIRIFGPYEGALDNSPQGGNERVELKRPDTPEPDGFVPYILVERIKYNDDSPWPESPDGDGPSLERTAPSVYGNEPANWSASLSAGGTPGAANSGVLVSKTAGWLYHDRGSDLGTGWRAADYDDSGWEDGNGPLGYPDTDPEIDTELDYGDDPLNKQITTYFRKAFTIDDPGKVDSLTLRIRYDDGYVAYLNGEEVARGGMAAGGVTYTTLANVNGGSGDSYEQVALNAHIGKLTQGVNVLAVEIHQISVTSSDIFMDLELVHTVTSQPTVGFPSFSPPDGSDFSGSVDVTISTTTTGATLFYTTDGSLPSDTVFHGSGVNSVQVQLTDSAVLKARGYKDDTHAPSAIASASYTEILPTVATPTITPNGGDFYGSVSVTITTVTAGATLFYTTDGQDPSPSVNDGSGVESVGFTLNASRTVKARGYKLDHNASSIASAAFWDQTPTVRFAQAASSGSESQTNVSVQVELSGTSAQTVRVDYQTTGGGSASAGADYTSMAGTLTFSPGQTQKDLTLVIVNDEDEEDDETVVLQISNPVNANLGTSTHTYTITDNDQLFVAYNDLAWVTGETTQNITLHTTGESGLLVDYNTGDDTPVTLAITGGNGPLDFQGAPPNAGTDGHTLFVPMVGLTGVMSYSTANLELTFSGMDPSLRYEIVLFGNRDEPLYTDRLTTVTLSGVEPGFANTSSSGAGIQTTTLTNDTTVLTNGYNTVNGYVARYTQVDPGPDGACLVTCSDNDSKFYANAVSLRALRPSRTETLVAKGASWKYEDSGSDLGTSWRAAGYSDGGWASGAAALGFPVDKPGIVTVVSYGGDATNKHTTTYFRKHFNLDAEPSAVDLLTLSVDYDDGFVAYLNGQEVARRAMPGDTINYDTFANVGQGTSPASDTIDITASKGALVQGDNVLAIEVHQISLTSSDLYMDAELTADVPEGPSTVAVIDKQSTWSYRKGTAEASAPGTTWRLLAFNSSAWSNGPAPFGYVGGGPLGAGTSLLDMQNSYESVFLRKQFVLDSPGRITQVKFDVDYDDGFIAWLNGEEIARVGVDGALGAFVAHDQTCSGYVSGSSANWQRTCNNNAMPQLARTNMLAAQFFNTSLGSSDAFFDLSLSVVKNPLSVTEDDDQDGMPNNWETEQLETTAYPAEHDADLDGHTDIQEYIAGTIATNADSFFDVTYQYDPAGVIISFLARDAAGTGYDGLERYYSLQYSDYPLGGGWQAVTGYESIHGQGQTVRYTNTTPSPVTHYRGQVWLE